MKVSIIVLIVNLATSGVFANGIINVKVYGAKGDGSTDDAKSIQRAIDAASRFSKTTIYFPAGIYNIASYTRTNDFLINYCINLHSNLDIKGDGDVSIIKLADHLFNKADTSANAHLFFGTDINNVSFSDLVIDMNGSNNLVPTKVLKNHAAIFAYGGENYQIRKVTIKNCSGTNMLNIMRSGKNLIVENCRFMNGGNYVGTSKPNSGQIDFSFVYSEWDSTIVRDNIIQQQNIDIALENYSGGIELHGNNSIASDNYIEGCWPAIYITSSSGLLENVTVENNIILNSVTGISFWIVNPMKNIVIENNLIRLTYARNFKNDLCVGIIIPNGNIKEYTKELANAAPVYDLQIIDNKIEADSMGTMSFGMLLHSLHQANITNNIIKGMNYGGIALQGSKWGTDSLLVEENSFIDFRRNTHPTGVAGYVVITDTYSPGIKDAKGFKNVLFSKNQFIRSNNKNQPDLNQNTRTGNAPKENFYGAFIALPQKMIDEIKFENNTFTRPREKVLFVKTD